MTTRSPVCLCAIAALITACGAGNQSAEAPPAISTSAAGALAPVQLARAAALVTEIRSAGEACDSVARSFLQGTRNGDEVWNAECADGHAYGIVSKADGTTEVLGCEALEGMTGTPCFVNF